jgi:hypothetical protein
MCPDVQRTAGSELALPGMLKHQHTTYQRACVAVCINGPPMMSMIHILIDARPPDRVDDDVPADSTIYAAESAVARSTLTCTESSSA